MTFDIQIQIPYSYKSERHYVIEVMLKEFLGLEINIKVCDRKNTKILIDHNYELIIADSLFTIPEQKWLTEESLPQQPLKIWDLETTNLKTKIINSKVPIIYGENPNNPNFFSISEKQIYSGLDIFGSAFFMLTRYEEVVKADRDRHDRFPYKASLAYQEGFLDRPIINEYLEILWACLNYLCPRLKRKQREFQLKLTHDVDVPFELNPFSSSKWLRRMGGDISVRRNLSLATSLFKNGCLAALKMPYRDRLDTFDWLMDQSEKIGVKSAFYFICGQSLSDPRYNIQDLPIRSLIRKIIDRGHEIGLHPSYDSYLNPTKLLDEANTLRNILTQENYSSQILGGRQHYLRWKATDTWQHWEDAGLMYDTSVGYAEQVGFRCGICYGFPTFNLKTRLKLKIYEYPLLMMEASLLSKKYQGRSDQEADYIIKKLLQSCKLFNGIFVLLWHNSSILTRDDFYLYQNIN